LGAWGGFKQKMKTVLVGIILSSLAIGLLGYSSYNYFYLGVAASFLIGLGLSVTNAPLMAVFQSVIAKDKQGRVFSLLGSISAAVSPLGLAIAGPAADAVGLRVIYYVAGAVCLVLALAAAFIPSVMDLEKEAAAEPKSGIGNQPVQEK
jgi:MFS transporter, DHA3 family, macrolide efflux protein